MSHRSPGVRSCCLSALLFLLGLIIVSQPPYVNEPPRKLRGAQAQPQIAAAYGKLPLQFELNRGQTDPRVQFLSRGSNYTLFLSEGEAVLQLRNADPAPDGTGFGVRNAPDQKARNPQSAIRNPQSAVVRLKLVGANPAPLAAGQEELPGKVNYFIGNDPAKWRTNVPTYARVKYREVYRGVDLVYYGNQRQLEHDFVVAPGAGPEQIRMAVEGAERVELDSGDLVLHAAGGDVRLRAPVAYQEVDGARRWVAASYVLQEGNPQSEIRNPKSDAPHSQEVGFELAAYDATRPLVIDPVLVYSTYFGGSGYDSAYTIAVDSFGSAYVAGMTSSLDFPTASPLRPSNGGYYDAFVAKLDPTGTALIYSTYLGGNDDDGGNSIAVDSSGNAYVTGFTWSSDFPTASPLKAWVCGSEACKDAFIAKLNPAGSALLYSTYLGGSDEEEAWGIAVDSAGNAYVTGYTYSIDFPTVNALRPDSGGYYDAFVAKLNAAGSALLYSTYLGGSDDDEGWGIAVDSAGNAYVAGYTYSIDFPTASPLQGALGGEGYGYEDAFIAKLNAAGSALVYSTYLGGSDNDEPWGIAVDSEGNVYITGCTYSTDFPTANALQPSSGGGQQDAFVAKLNAAGSALVYSTYLGGGDTDDGWAIAVDSAGNAYVIGYTYSTDFPTATPLQGTLGGYADAFIAKLGADGSALEYSTYLGGVDQDIGGGIAVDSAGNVYVVGFTYSADFPTAGPLQAASGGGQDVFIAKIGPASGSTDLALTKTGPTSVVAGSSITYTLTVTNNGPSPATGVMVRDPLPGSVTLVSATPSQGTCSGTTTVTCSLGSLAYLASATVTLVVQPAGAGTINNTASVSSNAGDPAPTDNSATATTVIPDFTLSVTPSSQTVAVGGAAGYTVTITGSEGFASSVQLSCSELPAGAACTFTPNPAPPGTSSLALSTSGSTPAGTSTITVNGTSGSLSHSATTSLTVNACNKTYVGSGTWETAASWSPTGVPASSDVACINYGSAVTLASNPTIAALLLGGTLTINSGTLTIASATTASVASGGAVLNLNGGTLSLAGSLVVQSGGAFNWAGGTISGGGSTTIAVGATLAVSGAVTLNNYTLNNAGTATWTGTGNISLSPTATINNSGLFLVQNVQSFAATYYSAGSINNSGTFRKTNSGTTAVSSGYGSIPFNNTGTVDIQAGTFSFGGAFTQTAGSTLLSGGGISAGTLSINGGSLGGAGTVTGNVSNAAAVSPGASAGTLVITGNYTQTATGVLNIEIGAASYDVLQVGGAATLAGTLNITRLSGYVPPAGSSFPVLTYASRSGSFTTTNGLDTGGGLMFQPTFGATAFSLDVGSNPVPSATSIAPSSAVPGGAGFTLAVTGANFTATSVVRWNGSDRATTFVSSTQLTAAIPAVDIAAAGMAQVTVFNPAPGGGTSSALAFTITAFGNPVPTLTALSPDNKTAGGPGFTLTVSGVNFVPAATVLWNDSPRVTTFVSSTQLTAEMMVSDLANAGTAQVTVSNPAPGGGPSATGLPFTIHPRGSYLVGDGSPVSGYDAGKFGDDAIDNLDLIVALRAVTSVPGFTPPNCSDLYDAMDAYPVDGSGRGGDGMLDNLDLIATLRRVTNADLSRPRRQTRGLICSAEAPPSRPVPMALPAESAAVGNLEFGPPAPAGIPVYLRAGRELNLSALSFSLGWAGARGKLRFVAADVGAPSLLDDALAGTLAMAWLEGMQLAAGQRLLLGFIDPAGAAGELPPAFYGVKANDRQTGAALRLATDSTQRR